MIDKMVDNDENFMIIKISIEHTTWIIASVYGPNNSDPGFYHNLERAINRLRGNDTLPIVIGGDWNTTWENRPANDNLDVFHMANAPNPQNCVRLRKMCSDLDQ